MRYGGLLVAGTGNSIPSGPCAGDCDRGVVGDEGRGEAGTDCDTSSEPGADGVQYLAKLAIARKTPRAGLVMENRGRS